MLELPTVEAEWTEGEITVGKDTPKKRSLKAWIIADEIRTLKSNRTTH